MYVPVCVHNYSSRLFLFLYFSFSFLRPHFSWDQRDEDFSLHYRVPPEFGPRPPISIHLAGQSRADEMRHFQQIASRDWESKVVVEDTRFHTHRRGCDYIRMMSLLLHVRRKVRGARGKNMFVFPIVNCC